MGIVVKGALVRSFEFVLKECGETLLKSFALGPGEFRARRQLWGVGWDLPRDLTAGQASDAIWQKLRQT